MRRQLDTAAVMVTSITMVDVAMDLSGYTETTVLRRGAKNVSKDTGTENDANEIKRLGIKFHDNDFCCVFTTFLKIMGDAGLASYGRNFGREQLTKADVAELFNRTAEALYWLAQNRLRYDNEFDAANYLRIEEKHVFFDDEVKTFIDSHSGWDNGEFFVLDTTVTTLQGGAYVYCV
jgi:hypothetical protein